MKLNVKTVSVSAIAIIVFGLIISKMDLLKAEEQKVSAPNDKTNQGIYIRAMKVAKESIEEVLQSKGSIIPNEEVVITSESSGKVTSITFKEGDYVKKGQLLVTLDDRELNAQLDKAKYEKEFLEKKVAREKQLNERGGVSDEQYESTQRDLQTTVADIDLIETQIEKKKIKAPFSGRIGLRYISEGKYITTDDVIAELVDASSIKIDFTLPEKYMARIKSGTEIQFKIDGLAETFNGKVYAVEPKIDINTRTISLRALSSNANGKILPGAFANVSIILNRIDDALCIPTEAIIPEMNTKKIFLVKDGKAVSANVETGLRLPDKIQITKGLAVGDSVIVSGILKVRNGTQLNILD